MKITELELCLHFEVASYGEWCAEHALPHGIVCDLWLLSPFGVTPQRRRVICDVDGLS